MRPASGTAPDMKRWRFFLALAFLVAVPCALFLPALMAGKMIYGLDVNGVHVAFHAEALQCLAAHQWPLWLNGVFGGMPGIAGCNLEFTYPTDFIASLCGLTFRVMGGIDAITHVALAGVGMFLLLRRLERSLSASLLGAFFFALAGSEISQVLGGFYNLMESVAWVPWAFWAAHKACAERSWFAWGLCGLAFAMQILAEGSQIFAYTLPAVALFTLGQAQDGPKTPQRGLGAGWAALAGLALALVLAALLSAPQLWLTLQYLPLASRHGYSRAVFASGSISLPESLTWVVPGLFGWNQPTYHGALSDYFSSEYFGLLPWALAFGAVSALWRRERLVRWMAVLAAAAFFFAQRRWMPFYAVFQRLPVLSGFRDWIRILFLVSFAVCVLAAYGWDALRAAPTRKAALRGAALFGFLALAATAFAWGMAKDSAVAVAPGMPWLPGSPAQVAEFLTGQARDSVRMAWALIAAGAGLLWFCARRPAAALALGLALAFHALDVSSMLAHCIHFVDPRTTIDRPDFTRPAPLPAGLEPWRVFDPNPRSPNNAMLLGYENLVGAESIPMQSYLKTSEAMQVVPGRWMDWLSLMNVRYIFAYPQKDAYLPSGKVAIYANPNAFPRAWLVGRSVRVAGKDAAYHLLADPRFRARSEVALEVDARLDGAPPKGGVRWLERSPLAFSLAVSTDKAAALVVSNTWYPSWKADVDGREAPVLKADGGLQALLLGPGSHRVDFHFDPGLFYDALAACLAGLAALAGLAWHERRPAGQNR